MKKNLTWILVVAVTALMQTTWPDLLTLEEVLPDLVLLLTVYFAIVDGEERAMFTGLLGGIYQDVASDTTLGHHVLGLVIVGYTASRLSTRLITEHPAVKVGLVFAAGVANGVIYTAILYVQDPGIEVLYTIANSVIPGAFYTGMITPLVFLTLALLFNWKQTLQRGTH